MQAAWATENLYELDAAPGKPKFMATFPYPYMNGKLHLGHGFTLQKAEVAVRYQRLKGKHALFPFGFHCTGKPIQAAATKLARELDTAAAGGPAAAAPESTAGMKKKVAAKSGGMSQGDILKSCGVPEEELSSFTAPEHWLHYFPPRGKADLQAFGLGVDWRRSFITTDANPFYDSFIRWHFNTLRKRDVIAFGKRPTIYSPLDGQACMDHDRTEGEGVGVQEYTLIKMLVQRTEAGALPAALASVDADNMDVFLVAATLRPETMYGQTNCFLLPDGEYGAYEMLPDASGKRVVFVCSERSARNMAYQSMTDKEGELKCLGTFTGAQLMGLPLSAPNATFKTVYTLPLLTISMNKGTGVVTSVPSDAPDDFAALRDLKNKPALREKYGIEDHMVMPFEVVEIIDIPGFGKQAAVTLCDQLKIKSQNDKAKLAEAKEIVYTKGFYEGVMLVGSCTGMTVCDAKPVVREEMIAAGQAAAYWEPDGIVVSRSGDACVVKPLDQWYLKYGEEKWRDSVLAHVNSENFDAYNPMAQGLYEQTLNWLSEWACTRSFGLGTRLPWDTQFMIESLSDSTIYMAYYTVAHLLQGGHLDGTKPGPLGLAPEQFTDEVWDALFLGAEAPGDFPADAMAALRKEFTYWYPLDLRVSGKDLIRNHLTMALYNHQAVWQDEAMMPRSFFTNGHVLVDSLKMSKSLGNFITLEQAIERWTPDGARFALADAGDSLDDANFDTATADNAILRLFTEEECWNQWLADMAAGSMRAADSPLTFHDRVMQARTADALAKADEAYAVMRQREALMNGFHVMQTARDKYRDACNKAGLPLHEGVLRQWMKVQCIALSPICPHWTDFMWREVLKCPDGVATVHNAAWPADLTADEDTLQQGEWLTSQMHSMRVTADKDTKLNKELPAGAVPQVLRVYIATEYPAWQAKVLRKLGDMYRESGSVPNKSVLKGLAAELRNDDDCKPFMKKIMPFAAQTLIAAEAKGEAAFSAEPPFDELALLQENMDYILRGVEAESVELVMAKDYPDNRKAERALPTSPMVEVVSWR